MHQYVDEIVGHCGYNRKAGAQVEGGALRVRRVDDRSLTNQNQGAAWNFPAGHGGSLKVKVRLEPSCAGMQLALCDRWSTTDYREGGGQLYRVFRR